MLILPTQIPLQPLFSELTREKGVSLHVLRLDTLDPYAGGNKFFKLKYNLKEVERLEHSRLLTFGGAWSNHLASVAASKQEGVGGRRVEVIAIVRGEEPAELSDTLRFCKERGMKLHFVSREEYRKRNEPEFIESLKSKFGDFYLLPEGGSNELAVRGCREILDLIKIDFDYVCCAVGSGGTLAGIASGLNQGQKALGFVALKGANYLEETIYTLMTSHLKGEALVPTTQLIHDYHFGGFAKTTPELTVFKKDFEKQFGFELDYVYTAKMFYGIFDLIRKDHFERGSTIVAVHTGGLQGNKGFTGS